MRSENQRRCERAAPRLPSRRALALAVLALFLVAAVAVLADAKKAKVYRYRTADGKEDYGWEVPPGATILAEVGEVEIPEPGIEKGVEGLVESVKKGGGATGLEVMLERAGDEPVAFGLHVALVFLAAVLVLRAFPPVFKTLDLDFDRALRMVMLILVVLALVAVAGYVVEMSGRSLGWSPRAELGQRTVDWIGWTAYVLAVVLIFWRRLGVSFLAAVVLAAIWVVAVGGVAVALWLFVMPSVAAWT